jgi:hypothetical protein
VNSAALPPRFTVEWTPQALVGLASALAAYFPSFGGRRVTRAERMLTDLLEDDPGRNGRSLPEGLHRIVASPLVAIYEIYPANNLVRIRSVGYFPV